MEPRTEEEGFFGSGKAPALGDQADPGELGTGCRGLGRPVGPGVL